MARCGDASGREAVEGAIRGEARRSGRDKTASPLRVIAPSVLDWRVRLVTARRKPVRRSFILLSHFLIHDSAIHIFLGKWTDYPAKLSKVAGEVLIGRTNL